MENSETIDSAVARERIMEDLKALAHDAEDLLKATAGDVSEKTGPDEIIKSIGPIGRE